MDIIAKVIVSLLIIVYGLKYFFAGFYGWRYPRIKNEWVYKGEHKNLQVRFWKIVIGIFLTIASIVCIIHMIGGLI